MKTSVFYQHEDSSVSTSLSNPFRSMSSQSIFRAGNLYMMNNVGDIVI